MGHVTVYYRLVPIRIYIYTYIHDLLPTTVILNHQGVSNNKKKTIEIIPIAFQRFLHFKSQVCHWPQRFMPLNFWIARNLFLRNSAFISTLNLSSFSSRLPGPSMPWSRKSASRFPIKSLAKPRKTVWSKSCIQVFKVHPGMATHGETTGSVPTYVAWEISVME